MKTKLFFLSMLAGAYLNAQTTVFSEGFDNVAALAGQGWTNTNQSDPLGASTWAQGGGNAFAGGGQAGGTTSFTLCNFNSTTGAGTISNWLITPPITVKNGDVISFYTRKGGTSGQYADRLEMRLSDQGSSSTIPSGATSVGSFTTLAVSVNPDLSTNTTPTNGYPLTWTQYSYTVSGLPADTSHRIAFRYFVEDGGPSGTNSNIIGVDTFAVTRPVMAVSESSKKGNLLIYPTTATHTLNVELKTGVAIDGISFYDMSGRSTGTVKADMKSRNSAVIDVSTLQPGTYIVNILTKEGTFSSKFIKK